MKKDIEDFESASKEALREGIRHHIEDSLKELSYKVVDLKQIRHNLFEIANHLGIGNGKVGE